MHPRRKRIAPIFAALIAVFVAVWLQRTTPKTPPTPTPAPASTPITRGAPTPAPVEAPVQETASRAASPLDQLDPAERAQVDKTLALIVNGGPFLHGKDGSVFSNREGRLPKQAKNYYREYTVETPGASNRGTRRIVRGTNGETYYTHDHYESFMRLE
jgi:guanyl-specific ribonuclease Sa